MHAPIISSSEPYLTTGSICLKSPAQINIKFGQWKSKSRWTASNKVRLLDTNSSQIITDVSFNNSNRSVPSRLQRVGSSESLSLSSSTGHLKRLWDVVAFSYSVAASVVLAQTFTILPCARAFAIIF
jgi:hypothetical protein